MALIVKPLISTTPGDSISQSNERGCTREPAQEVI